MFAERYRNTAYESDHRARTYGGDESVVKFDRYSLHDIYGRAGSLDLRVTA
jgi:hypothetical protein